MLKAKEVAAMLNVSKRHVYTLRERGELVGYWFGDTLRFDPADSSHTVLVALHSQTAILCSAW